MTSPFLKSSTEELKYYLQNTLDFVKSLRVFMFKYMWSIKLLASILIWLVDYFLEKKFYNRETIAALNYEMQQMAFMPPSLLCNSNN